MAISLLVLFDGKRTLTFDPSEAEWTARAIGEAPEVIEGVTHRLHLEVKRELAHQANDALTRAMKLPTYITI